jgi:hypothetical protein
LLGIYNRFIKPSAQEPIPLDETRRQTLIEALGKRFDANPLFEMQPEIFDSLRSKLLQPFLDSEDYKAYQRSLQAKPTRNRKLTSSTQPSSSSQQQQQQQQQLQHSAGSVLPTNSNRLLIALERDGRSLTALLEELPLSTTIQVPVIGDRIQPRVFGPPPFPMPSDFVITEQNVSVHIASTYPIFGDQGRQYGSPTADSVGLDRYKDCLLFAIADGKRIDHTHTHNTLFFVPAVYTQFSLSFTGCGWGEGSAHAAQLAVKEFLSSLAASRIDFTTVEKLSTYMIEAVNNAHSAVLDRFRVGIGTTTLLGGVLVKAADGRTLCCYVSIGDCKLFFLNPATSKVSELPNGKRSPTNLNDPGGRIGITDESNVRNSLPDVRNLYVGCQVLDPSGVLLMMSDGVHDNFNPSALGKSPAQVFGERAQAYKSWTDVPEQEAIREASNYRERAIENLIVSKQLQSLQQITGAIIAYCADTTKPAREVMEQGKRAPEGHGKMDHASIMCFKIDLS